MASVVPSGFSQSLLKAKLEEFLFCSVGIGWPHRRAGMVMIASSRHEDLVRKIRLEDVPEFIKLQDSVLLKTSNDDDCWQRLILTRMSLWWNIISSRRSCMGRPDIS